MKIVKYLLVSLLALAVLAVAALYLFIRSGKPVYEGEIGLERLDGPVDVYFDTYGVPHIYADNELDAWHAFGYVHAQERLFQMELMRRVGAGRLAEVFGHDLVKTDMFFRALGLGAYAHDAAQACMEDKAEPWMQATMAYLDGINEFIGNDRKPLSFTLAGIPARPFGLEDVFLISGYMAFTFQESFRTDPVLSGILSAHGPAYVRPFMPEGLPEPPEAGPLSDGLSMWPVEVSRALAGLPVGPMLGSNAWAVAPARSSTGAVLFCNDTHIGYAQPSPWYEAHLETPRGGIYGNFLAGFPFPLVGHTRAYAWGLTMLENDDLDFYRETVNPADTSTYLAGDRWLPFKTRQEVIPVKGGTETVFTVRSTRHGPLVNGPLKDFLAGEQAPVALSWSFTSCAPSALRATYGLSHAINMEDFRNACGMIEAPGLNVIYGDTAGNIAWWACGRIWRRPPHVNPRLILDGASGKDDPLGFYPFGENPSAVNPPNGILYSANHLPAGYSISAFPGYYAPAERADRIGRLLNAPETLGPQDMRNILADVVNEHYVTLSRLFVQVIRDRGTQNYGAALDLLSNWDGAHGLKDTGPVIFNKLLSRILDMAMRDEMDSASYAVFKGSHAMKASLLAFLSDEPGPWWDDISTPAHETRGEIFTKAFHAGMEELTDQLGPEMSNWTWDRVHTVEFVHPVGRQKPLDRLFNVGPFPAPGGNETINKSGFFLASDGRYRATLGPAMRILIDLADMEHAWSVLPTGQSGHCMSDHYADQADLYLSCEQRGMLMDEREIREDGRLLRLIPAK